VYRIASAIAGHPISREEADHYSAQTINDFFHSQIRITVSVTAPKENGKQYNNIDGFLTIKQPLPLFDEKKVPKENQPAEPVKTEEVPAQPASDFPLVDNPNIVGGVNVEDIPF
jgi:hypothetical protein